LVLGICQRPAVAGVVGPAAKRRVVANCRIVHGRERGVLPHRNDVLAAALLCLVARACEAAGRLVHLCAVDGLPAKALAVVLEPGIAVPITLAFGRAHLDRHVGARQLAAKPQCLGVALVLEAACIHKGLKRRRAPRQLDCPRLRRAE
jgi:hypothetical protein